ncbi:MAG TPA: hypothetical protein VMZ25_06270 [Terriglobales bacterium]|nr:hypothetical protein [Terriglobales bacterium]
MPQPKMEPTETKIPADISTNLRSLAHDLSNAIETIMQACYLLNQSKLDDTGKKWAEMVDNGARDAARINREIRDVLRTRS